MSVSDQEMKTDVVETRDVAQSANGRTGGKGWKLQKSATKSVDSMAIRDGREHVTNSLNPLIGDLSSCPGSNRNRGTSECSRGPS